MRYSLILVCRADKPVSNECIFIVPWLRFGCKKYNKALEYVELLDYKYKIWYKSNDEQTRCSSDYSV